MYNRIMSKNHDNDGLSFISGEGAASEDQIKDVAEGLGLTVNQYQSELEQVIQDTVRIFMSRDVYPLLVELGRPCEDDIGQECLMHRVVYDVTPDLTLGLAAIEEAAKEWEQYMLGFRVSDEVCLCQTLYPERNEVVIYIYD